MKNTTYNLDLLSGSAPAKNSIVPSKKRIKKLGELNLPEKNIIYSIDNNCIWVDNINIFMTSYNEIDISGQIFISTMKAAFGDSFVIDPNW